MESRKVNKEITYDLAPFNIDTTGNHMPEDFNELWYKDSVLNYWFSASWQETGDYDTRLSDIDLYCMYLMISI